METISLAAKSREITGKQVKQLRDRGDVPAVVYGHGEKNHDIAVEARAFDKVLDQAGESTLVDLAIDGQKPLKVLIQEVQRHPLSGVVMHADFRQVNLTEKLETDIELELVGEAPAVKALGGILIHQLDAVTVECLPTALVPSIEVDISGLVNYNDSIKVGDLTPPPGIEFVTGPEETIVVVSEPASEAEEEKAAGEAATAAAEGAAAPAEEAKKSE